MRGLEEIIFLFKVQPPPRMKLKNYEHCYQPKSQTKKSKHKHIIDKLTASQSEMKKKPIDG